MFRAVSIAVHKSGQIFQIGSQQRSTIQFRYAAELVRNGRIGRLKTVEVGLPGDPSGEVEPEMPVPKGFNYEAWLGSTPHVFYTEKRVHPQVGYDRPGWLRCEQFGAGMITGWGSHHVDSAHGERAVGRPRRFQDLRPVRQRRHHGDQRRFP